MKRNGEAGFSLVELMIVVAIIGILASIAVPNFSAGAKRMLARNHLRQIVAQIKPLRISDDRNLPLIQITGSSCTSCAYPTGTNLSLIPVNAATRDAWSKMGFDSPPLDPWKRPYLLDENDEEFNGDCRMDAFYSAGPDGIFEGQGDGDDVGGDDVVVRMSWVRKTNCRENPRTGGF